MSTPEQPNNANEQQKQLEAIKNLASTINYSGLAFFQGLWYPVQSIGAIGVSESIFDESIYPYFIENSLVPKKINATILPGKCIGAQLLPMGDTYTTSREILQLVKNQFASAQKIDAGNQLDLTKHAWILCNTNEEKQEFALIYYGREVGERLEPVVLYGVSSDTQFCEKLQYLLTESKNTSTRESLAHLIKTLHPQCGDFHEGHILNQTIPIIYDIDTVEVERLDSSIKNSGIPTGRLNLDASKMYESATDGKEKYINDTTLKLQEQNERLKQLKKKIIFQEVPLEIQSDAKRTEERLKTLFKIWVTSPSKKMDRTSRDADASWSFLEDINSYDRGNENESIFPVTNTVRLLDHHAQETHKAISHAVSKGNIYIANLLSASLGVQLNIIEKLRATSFVQNLTKDQQITIIKVLLSIKATKALSHINTSKDFDFSEIDYIAKSLSLGIKNDVLHQELINLVQAAMDIHIKNELTFRFGSYQKQQFVVSELERRLKTVQGITKPRAETKNHAASEIIQHPAEERGKSEIEQTSHPIHEKWKITGDEFDQMLDSNTVVGFHVAILKLNHLYNLAALRKIRRNEASYINPDVLTRIRDSSVRFATIGKSTAQHLPLPRAPIVHQGGWSYTLGTNPQTSHTYAAESITPSVHASQKFLHGNKRSFPISDFQDQIVVTKIDISNKTILSGYSDSTHNAVSSIIDAVVGRNGFQKVLYEKTFGNASHNTDWGIKIYQKRDGGYALEVMVLTTECYGHREHATPYCIEFNATNETIGTFLQQLEKTFTSCSQSEAQHVLYYLASILYFQSDITTPYLPHDIKPIRLDPALPYSLSNIGLAEHSEQFRDNANTYKTALNSSKTDGFLVLQALLARRYSKIDWVTQELKDTFRDGYEPMSKQLRKGIELLSTKADILVEKFESNIRVNTERLNRAVVSIKSSQAYAKLKILDPNIDAQLEDITHNFYGGTDYYKSEEDVLKSIVGSMNWLFPPVYLNEAMDYLFNKKPGLSRYLSKFGARDKYNNLLQLIVNLQAELGVESAETAQEEMNKRTHEDAWESINFDRRYREKSLRNS